MTPTATLAAWRARARRSRTRVIHSGGQACARFGRRLAESFYVIAGLAVIDVAAYLWHLEAGLIVTGLSLFVLDIELGA